MKTVVIQITVTANANQIANAEKVTIAVNVVRGDRSVTPLKN